MAKARIKTKIVRIGNSQGVRIPKPLLEQAGLEGEVVLRLSDRGLLLEAAPGARAGWAEAARSLRERGGARLPDEPTPTRFDDTEWTWE